MTTTPDPIAAIERALEGVTPGPWEAKQNAYGTSFIYGGETLTTSVGTEYRELVAGGNSHDTLKMEDAAYIAACNPVAISALLAIARQAAEKDAEIARLRRLATDRKYMLEAYRNMLGPKGLEVATIWERQGVTRQHTSWGPDAYSLSGEERAQVLLDVQTAVSVPMDFNDSGLPTVNVRALTTETSDAH
jgi:hypothetical protein